MKNVILIFLLAVALLSAACTSFDPETPFVSQSLESLPPQNESLSEEPSLDHSAKEPNLAIGEYSFVSEHEDKRTILFYKSEQIERLAEKRTRGERYSVSKEEFDFIIYDTISAFEEYDEIHIRDMDGVLHKYYGLRFYSSQSYYSSFCGFDLGVTDATFDYRRDLFEVLFMRLSVLSSSVQAGFEPGGIIFSDTDDLTDQQLADLAAAFETVYVYNGKSQEHVSLLQAYAGAGILFDIRDCYVLYVDDLTAPLTAEPLCILGNEHLSPLISPLIGHYKYDTGTGKAVIVELYEEQSQELIARIRLDETNHPEEIAKIEELASFYDNGAPSTGDVITKYRAVVYLNGICILGFLRDSAIKYNPDGDLDRFDVTYGEDVFPKNPLWLKGAKPLTEYINSLLKKELS